MPDKELANKAVWAYEEFERIKKELEERGYTMNFVEGVPIFFKETREIL